MSTQKEEVGDQGKDCEEWAREEPASERQEVNRKKRPHFGDVFLSIFWSAREYTELHLHSLSSVEDQK